MSLLPIVVVSAVFLIAAYAIYGRFLSRLFRLNPDAPTPAVTLRDDVDYVPIETKFLIGQHFSAIAAAGPIVGPILAGLLFGWGPALLWILVGSVLIGGVHDMSSLVASIRHRATSIAEVVRDHMSRRSYLLFLVFIWITLVYIIVAFTDITASAFVGEHTLENGQKVLGGGIATSSLLYLALPIMMGLLLRFTKLSLAWATVIFLPLVVVAIWVGQYIPLDVAQVLGITDGRSQKVWDVLILVYCLIAAVMPMWLLLQPRGHLGGYFLGFFLVAGTLGLLFGGRTIHYPMFTGWESKAGSLTPMLFITIACGACSGFHSLVASGTTSKQLRRETDARAVGYGTMLMEAMVAVIALSCVMMISQTGAVAKQPANVVFARGIAGFLEQVGIPPVLAMSTMLMAFTTFVYDTLDVCTRLGKYIVQELLGWSDWKGAWIGTAATAFVPLVFLLPAAEGQAAWQKFWHLFGASNQLLAALALLGVTVWLWRTQRRPIFLAVTGLPCLFMYVMSVWALVWMVMRDFRSPEGVNPVVPWVGIVLLMLAALMMLEAVKAFSIGRAAPPAQEAVAPA